jgi:carbon-monoxide dehydrogenase large subunit
LGEIGREIGRIRLCQGPFARPCERIVGERSQGRKAGTAGAPACVVNAINDALRPLGATPITVIPATPDVVLKALGKI